MGRRSLVGPGEVGTVSYFDNSMIPAQRELAHPGGDPPSAGVRALNEAAIVRYAQRCTRMKVIGDVPSRT